MADEQVPVPDDALATLTDAEQVAILEQTSNALDPADELLPQPPQDGSYTPEDE